MTIKKTAKKTWNFLWNSDSPSSWFVDLIIAFVLVRFVIFPLLGLLLATSLPLVVIESGSMHHDAANFDDWWLTNSGWYENEEISKEEFSNWRFNNGLDKGDIIITKGKDSYEIGDIIIFTTNVQKTPIIHRIVLYNDTLQHFETKGDNNPTQLPYEKLIREGQVVGSAWARIPKIGWIKLAIVEFIRGL